MNDNEIIKALECCIKDSCDCGECPAIAVCQHDPDCPKTIALALINRQKAEIENYKQIAEHQQSVLMDRHFEIKRLKAELERLKAYYKDEFEKLRITYDVFYESQTQEIKAEAIKEFAERLKAKICTVPCFDYMRDRIVDYEFITKYDLANLVKEMGGACK